MRIPSIQNLRQGLDTLQAHLLPLSEVAGGQLSLKEGAIFRYMSSVLDELKPVLLQSDNPNLDTGDAQAQLESFKGFITKNWTLINSESVCYTALPDHDITKLLCDLTEYVVAKQNKLTPQSPISPIQLLMPTVNTEHSEDDPNTQTRNLTKLDLRTVLKTHVLGVRGLTLIPVATLLDVSITSELTKIPNAYHDVTEHPEDLGILNEQVVARLFSYSDLTRSLLNLREQYAHLNNESQTLLSHLQTLIRALLVNSSHGGIGTAEVAAKGGMIAVAQFFEYYNKLTAEQKEAVPKTVLDELNLLKKYAESDGIDKDAQGNPILVDATRKDKDGNEFTVKVPKAIIRNADIGSCLGTRKADLEIAVNANLAQLENIGISDTQKSEMLTKIRIDFETTQASLKDQLMRQTANSATPFFGYDALPVTAKLLIDLNVSFNPNTPDDLAFLKQLSADEIKALCLLPNAKDKIVTAIGTLENLVIFILDMLVNTLGVLFEEIKLSLTQHIVQTPKDFSGTLISLNTDQYQIVARILASDCIKTATDFKNALYHLSADQRTVVYEALKDRLPGMIQTANDFKNVLFCLSADQRTAVYEALKDRFPGMIQTANDFKNVLSCLSADQIIAVCEALKDRLPGIIQTAGDFYDVLCTLSENQRTVVYEALKDCLPGMIQTTDDFYRVFFFLSAEQKAAVCEALKDRWQNIINISCDFDKVFCFLSANQITAVLYGIITAYNDAPKAKSANRSSFFNKKEISPDIIIPLLATLHFIQLSYGDGTHNEKLTKLIHDIRFCKNNAQAALDCVERLVGFGGGLGHGKLNTALNLLLENFKSGSKINIGAICTAAQGGSSSGNIHKTTFTASFI